MKPTINQKEHYLLTIRAEDRPGLIHQITGMIERRGIAIKSMNFANTDIHEIVVLTVEIEIVERELVSLGLKLEKIIEVYSVKATRSDEVICLRVAYFKMAKSFLETPQLSALRKYGASILNVYPKAVLVAGYGSELAIRNLYNELEGPYLLAFTQTGLLSDQAIMEDIEERVMERKSLVIYKLAA